MPKTCNKPDCDYAQFGGGYCKFHQRLRTDKKPATPKKRNYIKKVSEKKKTETRRKKMERNGEDTDLQKWYMRIMRTEIPVCWETDEPISTSDFGWHGSIAHILDKKNFPSVKTHPLNYLILNLLLKYNVY